MLWIVKVIDAEGTTYSGFESQNEALVYAKMMGSDAIGRYMLADEAENDWKDRYAEEEEQYKNLTTELEGLRAALGDAKAESEKRVEQIANELRIARTDIHTLEEVIVKMAMRLVGM